MRYSIPPVCQLRTSLDTEGQALDYLMGLGVLPREVVCKECGGPTTLRLERKVFCCKHPMCRSVVSMLKGTFFAGHKIQVNNILEVAYYWLGKSTCKQIETFTGVSNRTVTSFVGYLRQLVADSLDEIDFIIGGVGVTVEIDETKLGKRKYNRGHRVDGVWVLVGVERTAERKVFLRILPDRSAKTLEEMILRHVLPGTTVVTDCWRGYNSLESLGYVHMKVNHTVCFKDNESGACTNTVEGTNNAIKMSLHPRLRTSDCEDNLFEFIWRRKHVEALWDGIIQALIEVTFND